MQEFTVQTKNGSAVWLSTHRHPSKRLTLALILRRVYDLA
jgi:hypothetical protein